MSGSETILVVDDESRIARILEFNLSKQGYRVLTASDGAAALEAVAAEKPDLVLLDVMMPGMDGFEVCRSLKDDPATETIPVVLLTAKGQEIDRDTGTACGADAYMTKPFSPRDLLKRIRNLLDGAEASPW